MTPIKRKLSEGSYDIFECYITDTMGFTFRDPKKLKVHKRSECKDRPIPCAIHDPSDHHMKDWDYLWRGDRHLMERLCPHGIGHPDPDHLAWVHSNSPALAKTQGIHGCDGCCFPPERN
ncbi:MAG TPA: hypothetical protein VGR89_06780 [Puia sp.]|nr:hypothetical protein [Puia sp.]